MEDRMIQALAVSARMAFTRTSLELRALHDSVERAGCLAGRLPWDRKEKHLRGLLYMWRLALSSSQAAADEAAA